MTVHNWHSRKTWLKAFQYFWYYCQGDFWPQARPHWRSKILHQSNMPQKQGLADFTAQIKDEIRTFFYLTIVELEVMQHFQSCFFNTCQLIINYMRLFLNNIFMMIWYCLHLTVQFRLIVLTNFKSLTKHGAFDFFLHPSFDDNLLLKGSIIDLHLIVIEYSTSMELVPYE